MPRRQAKVNGVKITPEQFKLLQNQGMSETDIRNLKSFEKSKSIKRSPRAGVIKNVERFRKAGGDPAIKKFGKGGSAFFTAKVRNLAKKGKPKSAKTSIPKKRKNRAGQIF